MGFVTELLGLLLSCILYSFFSFTNSAMLLGLVKGVDLVKALNLVNGLGLVKGVPRHRPTMPVMMGIVG